MGYTPGISSKMTSGTYTGNAAQDRDIPHGLGRSPKLIRVLQQQGGQARHGFTWQEGLGSYTEYAFGAVNEWGEGGIRGADATNFVVGNPTGDYTNRNTIVYRWVAIS